MAGPILPDGDSGTPSTELALLSLIAQRHDDWASFFGQIGVRPLPVREAVRTLTGRNLSPILRLRVLHDLGNLGLLQEMEEEARLLAGEVAEGDRFAELVNLANQPSLSFREFVESLQDQGMVSTAILVMAPDECTASPTGSGPDAPTRIVASFEAPGNPRDFSYGADPLHWPECNNFFLEMEASNKQPLPTDNVDNTAYTARVREVVGIPLILELKTLLDVRYFVTNEAVGMDFTFAGSIDGEIDVDHGYVIVEAHPTKQGRVVVRSQKTVHFTRLSNLPASFACEIGWVDVMQNMATCTAPN